MIQIQTYVQAQTLEEAWQLNQKRSARILGGMLWLKMESLPVSTAIDLCRLGLDAIEETEEQFTLGAMVTLRQIEQHAGLNAYTQGAAARAVQDIVGVQFRNMATLGGSLWSRFGFSDLLTWMLSMDTWVQLYQGGLIPLEQFAAMPYDRDLLVRVIVYKRPGRFAYQAMRNQSTDIPVLNCAFSQLDGVCRRIHDARDVALYGFYQPGLLAKQLQFLFLSLGRYTESYALVEDLAWRARTMEPGDLAIFL